MLFRTSPAWVFTLLLITVHCTSVRAQIECPESLCGDFQVGFVGNDGSNVVFCEGTTITLSNTSATGLDYFEIDWQDGSPVERVDDYSDVSHVYTITQPDDGSCKTRENFNIAFRGIKECAAGVSCQPVTIGYSIRPKPDARMSVSNEVCAGRPVQFTSTSCNAGTFSWDFGDGQTSTEESPQHTYDAAGTYTVTLLVSGVSVCSAFTSMTSQTITIVTPPNALFSVSDDDLIACEGETITFTNDSNDDTNIEWSISPSSGWMFIDTNMTVFSEVISITFNNDREYTVTLTGRNDCDEVETEQTISIQEAPSVNNLTDLTGCDQVTVSPSVLGYNVSGGFTSVCWEFPDGNATNVCAESFGPVEFTSSGRVQLIVTSLCGEIEREAMVNVQSSEPPTLTAGSGYCTSSPPDTLAASSPGGEWSGNGIVNASLGVFDPSVAGSGSHELTYEITSGACQNSSMITVNVTESATVQTEDIEVCLDGGLITLTATPGNGTWSGTGITSPSGTFDPSVAGVGTARPVYSLTDANMCRVEETATINVAAIPAINHRDTAVTCNEDETVNLVQLTDISAEPGGGTYNWSLNGSPLAGQTFNPTDLPGPGIYTLSFTYQRAPCSVTGEVIINVIEKPVLTIDPQPILCANGDPVPLSANLADGTWSGPGIVDQSIGLFDPGVAGIGTHTITYEITEGTCLNSGAIDLQVVAGETVTAPDAAFCLDGAPAELSALPLGGTWSGTGIIDSLAGTFDPGSAGVGTAAPVYTFVDVDGCVVTARPEVQVFSVPEVESMDTALACLVNEVVSLSEISGVNSGGVAGSYRWTVNGTELSGQTFNPTADLPGPGVYPISFVFESGPCSVPDTLALEIIDNPQLTLTPQDNICISAGTLTLEANLSGGRWSGESINPLTGEIDLEEAGGGTFEYTYSFQPGGSCAQTAMQLVTIENPAAMIDAGGDVQACENRDLTFTLSGAAPAGGYWTGSSVTDSLTGTVDLTQLTAGESYTYTYNFTSPTTPGCNAAADRALMYNPAPDPNFMRDGSPCINEEFNQEAVQTGAGFTYLWDLGDGTTSSESTVNHTYTSGGTFTQTLTVTSPRGCPADTTTTVYVTTPPSPQFALDSTLGCAPFVLTLNDQSSGDDFTSFWLVAGDTIAGGGTQEILLDGYLTDTEVSVTLVAENFCGARTQEQRVVVKPYPAVDFGFNVDDGCSLFVPDISNVTLGNPDQFFWDMGNGVTGTDSLPPYAEYFTPADSVSTYQVTLISTNECGADTLTRPVTVHPPDVSAFIGLDTVSGCQPWTFEPRSFSTPGASLAWEVLAPDGTIFASGNDASPSFELTQVGVHRVILSAARCGSDRDTTFVNVLPAPTVSFLADPAVCRGDTLTLTNTSSGIAGGLYDLGNGQTTDQLNTTVTYSNSGIYQISFTGFSSLNNCPATVTRQLVVNELPQIALAASDSSGCSPLNTTFSEPINAGVGLTYSWDFGDGNNAVDETTPTHEYRLPGDYFPTLTATDENGCRADTFLSRIVVYEDPLADFILADDTPCARYDSLRIVNASEGANDFVWTVEDTDFSGQAPTLPILSPGAFSVRLLATNTFGCTDEATQTVNALPSPEAIASIEPADICLGSSTTFSSTSTGATSILWDFGDNTGSTASEVVHVYTDAGTYPVSLVAANTNGCPSDTLTRSFTVNPLPVADYTFASDILCGTPAEITFNNTSVGAVAYRWNFGDGSTATSRNASNTYRSFGTYQPSLIVETAFGCTDTVVRELIVSGNPVADFNPPPPLACSPYLLTLEATPTEAVRYEWYLDDAFQPTVGPQFDSLLTEPDVHDIRLIAIYDDNCRDTLDVADLIRLEARPVASFTHETDGLPNRLGDVFFQSTSTGDGDLWWDLGDGTIQTAPAFLHEYRINRDITVTHAITQRYDQGLVCSDTIRESIAPEWITTFYVPNAISPESGPDEVRQWGAKGFGVSAYTLEVYSAYGQLIFSTSELEDTQPTGRWNGRWPDQSDFVLQGAYTWRASVVYVDGNTENLVGTVTVVR